MMALDQQAVVDDSSLAAMTFDGAHLLLPQPAVTSIEMTTGLDTDSKPTGTIGTIRMGSLKWPAYALNPNFERLQQCPEHFRYCVVFNQGTQPAFAFACEEVVTISIAGSGELEPVQACMQTASNPVKSLMIRDGKLLLVSDVEAMQNFLSLEVTA